VTFFRTQSSLLWRFEAFSETILYASASQMAAMRGRGDDRSMSGDLLTLRHAASCALPSLIHNNFQKHTIL
jgi:hypothetical protein